MTLNDFKSVEGDTRMGIRSLPVQLGVEQGRALRLPGDGGAAGRRRSRCCCAWERPVARRPSSRRCCSGQSLLMGRLLAAPRERAAWYNATGTTLYVLGMLVAPSRCVRGAGRLS